VRDFFSLRIHTCIHIYTFFVFLFFILFCVVDEAGGLAPVRGLCRFLFLFVLLFFVFVLLFLGHGTDL